MVKIVRADAAASQTEHPGRATLRTLIQSAILAFPILLALPEILTIIDEELGAYLPDAARGWLALIAALITAGAAALARIMAIPAVEAALRRLGLGAAPTDDPERLRARLHELAASEVDETPPPDDYGPRH